MTRQPAYGVGLAYRKFFHADILANRDSIDFLELPTIDYVERSRRVLGDPSGAYLREVRDALPCVAHGISLSVGSVEPVSRHILKETRSFLEEFEIDEFSDHLTFHRMGEQDLTVFMAMPFEDEAAQWIASQYNEAKKILGRPFGLEIVTYTFPVAGSEMSEVEFINRVAEYCDCWFLFDSANLFINSTNHNYDPLKYLEELNGERVLHMHMAGGHYEDGQWIDSHSQPVSDEVFEVLEMALQHTSARAIVLERDDEPENFGSIVDDLARAREIFYKYRPEEVPEELVTDGTPTFDVSRLLPELDLDDLPPALAGLREYQKALITCAFDMADGKHHGRTKDEIIAGYQMPNSWKARWADMDWQQMLNLKRKMGYVQEFEENAARFYKMVEMQEWAQQLGPEEFFKGHVGR